MSIFRKLALVLFSAAIPAVPVLAQDWGVGASIGLTNDVEHRIRLDRFDPRDANAWVDFRLDEHVLLRGTLGSIKTRATNSGAVVEIDGEEFELPEFKDRIDYFLTGVSYQFWEGDYTSGIFGGIGGYRIDPESVDADLREFQDPKETVFGFHAGIEGDLRVISHLSIVGRLTFHKIFSDVNRSLLTASVGAAFRF